MSEEYEIEAIGVEVSSQPIELYKVLKIANAVSGGGEAKVVIADGYVAVNGELEQRKRCKVYDGDLVEFNQEFYLVICNEPVSEPVRKSKVSVANTGPQNPNKTRSKKAKSKKSSANQPRTKADKKSEGKTDSTTGRKPILF
ncbi:RNA-binding S4 domain-containing protein [Motilimonas pumila]|uniref:Urease n=1 Tax=Motilimonas pumila TaxID=2303987 RepID=A0A418YCN2_9GAMM|nr:RNA-binding S4 domain-containing protein [Motilimonas pumila]RJG42241.1 urease [Motilimonas pumila]